MLAPAPVMQEIMPDVVAGAATDVAGPNYTVPPQQCSMKTLEPMVEAPPQQTNMRMEDGMHNMVLS